MISAAGGVIGMVASQSSLAKASARADAADADRRTAEARADAEQARADRAEELDRMLRSDLDALHSTSAMRTTVSRCT